MKQLYCPSNMIFYYELVLVQKIKVTHDGERGLSDSDWGCLQYSQTAEKKQTVLYVENTNQSAGSQLLLIQQSISQSKWILLLKICAWNN